QGEADMIPASFEYAVARDIADAIQLLASSGGEGKVLAGGQSLIPLMKFRLAQPALLVDLNRVTGLAEIRENGDLRIGALERKVGDFAIAGVAVMLALDDKGKIGAVGVGVTNAGPTAIRARKAEELLRGQSPDDKTIAAAAAAAAGESKPWSDLRGPAEYKLDVIRVLTQRAIRKALARAAGGK